MIPARPLAALSIIGVGPGDPELLAVRAVHVLRHCDFVMHAGRDDRSGFAFDAVAPYLNPGQEVVSAGLSMRRGRLEDRAQLGYERVASRLIAEARAGRRAAFLTEGDALLYGSGSYVYESLQTMDSSVRIEIVPGIDAASAAAARLGWPLAQKDDIWTVCPGTYHRDDIGSLLDRGGPCCWLKVRAVLPELVQELRTRGRVDRAALVEKVGRPEERVFLRLDEALEADLSYFSLVLVR